MKDVVRRAAIALLALTLSACSAEPTLESSERDADWRLHGLDHGEQRHSELDQIRAENVSRLGLAWSHEIGSRRGLEATPIVADGVIYVTAPWSLVHALDAASGELLWEYDPEVSKAETAHKACCDVVNRGVALHQGRVYLGALDGRLIALDAKTGRRVWEVQTVDPSLPYTITGAPRVVKGLVVIGNGGAEYGVRGYVSAYHAASGEMAWRFYTVPGNPAEPFEHPELEMAAKTWSGEWWRYGGGGTAWDSMAYDAELDLLYVGTGNGSPWSRSFRSPEGGDNLFVSSILALRPETGELVWHYQTTPGDRFDYTATQHMILAELEIEGRVRKVLMQAPKNGFFYLLDRTNGELISAEPYVKQTWASGIDETGRPIENAALDPTEKLAEVWPSTKGGHNWQPMAFHPGTGLVYFPAIENANFYLEDPAYEYVRGDWNLGYDFLQIAPRVEVSGHLLAWDPVARREAWSVELPNAWNGGVLATAGGLVFHGTGTKTFAAYRASDGERLWETEVPSGIIAPPVTYALGGKQYVAVLSGWGGGYALNMGAWAARTGNRWGTPGRLLVFSLDGKAAMPVDAIPEPVVEPIAAEIDRERAMAGMRVFHTRCLVCHGPRAVGGGALPDVRMSAPGVYDALDAILLEGAYAERGMPSFAGKLEADDDVAAIRHYLLLERAQLLEARTASSE